MFHYLLLFILNHRELIAKPMAALRTGCERSLPPSRPASSPTAGRGGVLRRLNDFNGPFVKHPSPFALSPFPFSPDTQHPIPNTQYSTPNSLRTPSTLYPLRSTLPTDGWRKVETLRASGFEQLGGGHPNSFVIVRSRNRLLYEGTLGIDGCLAGLLRTEVDGQSGAYTWLSGTPGFVLKLPEPSTVEVYDSTFPSRFNSRELNGDLSNVARVLGKNVQHENSESICSRDCAVLAISDSTPLVHHLWVDGSTGMVLRQVDRLGGTAVYRRQFDVIETGVEISDDTFVYPSKAVVIRGPVTPDILLAAGPSADSASYPADVTSARAASRIENGSWILSVLPPQDYTYSDTKAYDWTPGKTLSGYDNPLIQQSTGVQITAVGQIPARWTEEQRRGRKLSRDEDILASRGGVRGAALAPMAYEAPDGRFISVDAYRARGPLLKSQIADPNEECMVRSEFLERTTGDTISFIQIRNAPTMSAFAGYRLNGPNPAPSPLHSDMVAYTIAEPSAVNVVEWSVGATKYVLAATGLDLQTLQRMADQAG